MAACCAFSCLTRHPPLAQVAYALTIGAHALLRVKHEDVPELLLGMEELFSSCFQAVTCMEVHCPVSRLSMVHTM